MGLDAFRLFASSALVFNRSMRLLAVSDLHLKYEKNKELLLGISDHKEDWQIGEGIAPDSFLREILPAENAAPPGPGVLRWSY